MAIRFALLVAGLAISGSAMAQGTPLPEEWHGLWRGDLPIPAGGTIPMSLEVEPLESGEGVTWRITYGEQVRDYEMLPGDEPGRHIIDEKNGVLLDARVEDDVIYSAFDVGDTMLVARFELVDAGLRYEFLTFSQSRARLNSVGEGDALLAVRSLWPIGRQHAVLEREEMGS